MSPQWVYYLSLLELWYRVSRLFSSPWFCICSTDLSEKATKSQRYEAKHDFRLKSTPDVGTGGLNIQS